MDSLTARDIPILLAFVAGLAFVGALILWRPPAVRRFLDRYRVSGSALVGLWWLVLAVNNLSDGHLWRAALDVAAAVAVVASV